MAIQDLINKKAERLESVPDELLSKAGKAELALFKDLQALLKDLKTKDGFFVSDRANLELAGRIIDLLKEAFYASEYAEAVITFAGEFDNQLGLNDEYLKRAFPEFEESVFGKAVVDKAKRNAVDLLLNAEAETRLFLPLKDVIEEAVVSGARYRDTLDVLSPYFEGENGGVIKQYSSQVAHDVFAISDREYMSVVSDEIGAEWFKYSGSKIATSRAFCSERHEKFFHYLEIEGWVDCKRVDGQQTPQRTVNGCTWAGMIEGTSKQTIYSYAGGWNCRHSIVPVSIFIVPQEVLQRNIKSGNFVPTEFETKELLNG